MVDLLPISLVGHYVFCPRRAWLEAAGEATDTWQMAEGAVAHAATDDPAGGRSGVFRAVEISDSDLSVQGRCDTLEVDEDGSLIVVEYKSTPVRRQPTVTRPMRVQLALQVQALRTSGHRVSGQAVYFSNHRIRIPVALDDSDLDSARAAVVETRAVIGAPVAPPALEDDPRCDHCSHAAICLPEERAERPVTRRIVVANPDAQVVHLATPGSRASVRDNRLLVHRGEERLASLPIERVQGVVVHGNVDLSGGLIRELLWRSLAIVWCSGSGRVVGWAVPGAGPNGAARIRQHVASADGRLDRAREFVVSKIANQATLLRRNGLAPVSAATMRGLQRRAVNAQSVTELLGCEGEAAALYFASFATMLAPGVRASGLTLQTRSGRPAPDPVNAALNYAYALLLADVIRAVVACGLDPHAGFLHSSARNKPALALDLCEEFRPTIADSTVVGALNNRELVSADFSSALETVRLREAGRRKLIAAYERRVQTEFRHPVFGYRTTWRRAMEIQARMILGVIDGTQPRYAGIRVR